MQAAAVYCLTESWPDACAGSSQLPRFGMPSHMSFSGCMHRILFVAQKTCRRMGALIAARPAVSEPQTVKMSRGFASRLGGNNEAQAAAVEAELRHYMAERQHMQAQVCMGEGDAFGLGGALAHCFMSPPLLWSLLSCVAV